MKPNHNSHPGKKFRRGASVAVAATGFVAGAALMHAHDNQDAAVAKTDALPYCEVPATAAGLSTEISSMGVDPGSAEVRLIHADGQIVNPNKDADSDFGRLLETSDMIAVNHVGTAACRAAGGESTYQLFSSQEQPHVVASK